MTVYEALEDAGLTAGRGQHHLLPRPDAAPADRADPDAARVRAEALLLLQPLRVGRRPGRRSRCATGRGGTIDAYAGAVGRWLVTRDGFDFLVYYLSDYDYASHAQGPDAAHEALARCDEAVGGAGRGRGRRGGVPRALRRRPLRRPRADARRARSRGSRTSTRDGARDRVEPRRDGLRGDGELRPLAAPARRARGGRRRPLPRGRARRSRGATARSCASLRTASGCRRRDAATRRSSTTRTGSSAPGRRSRTRTPASCSSRPRSAGSSPTSPGATTRAAARTARS